MLIQFMKFLDCWVHTIYMKIELSLKALGGRVVGWGKKAVVFSLFIMNRLNHAVFYFLFWIFSVV